MLHQNPSGPRLANAGNRGKGPVAPASSATHEARALSISANPIKAGVRPAPAGDAGGSEVGICRARTGEHVHAPRPRLQRAWRPGRAAHEVANVSLHVSTTTARP